MRQKLARLVEASIKQLFGIDQSAEVTLTDTQHGDYATNVALKLSRQLSQEPMKIAADIIDCLKSELDKLAIKAELALPGFINFNLSDRTLIDLLSVEPDQLYKGQSVVVEYSDPNPFKILHAGHLYTSIVGDSIANFYEATGANVHRVNFGGDIGLHVAKNIWSISKTLGGLKPAALEGVAVAERANWLSQRYVEGNAAYESDLTAKNEIIDLNQKLYQVVNSNDQSSDLSKVYWACRQWSYQYFETFYATIGSRFEKYYPESQTAPIGLRVVREQLAKGVYEQSDGAIVFRGEKYGLHTRVFINSKGLPTYETKDVGLIMAKWADYHFDKSVVITGNEINDYMKVVLKSVEQYAPELTAATIHLTHGMVRLSGGVKMSSRQGNFIKAEEVLEITSQANYKLTGQNDTDVSLGAIKFAFLKQRIGGDIIYSPDESVSLEGASGPYLQYAYVRAISILQKADKAAGLIGSLDNGERKLARKLAVFNDILAAATVEHTPSSLANYLYELTQDFNSFYEANRVIGSGREAERLALIKIYTERLKTGLGLLGIVAPHKM